MQSTAGSWLSGRRIRANGLVGSTMGVATLALLWLSPLVARARTWHVEHDPNQPIDQIGQVVLAAASGDSVVIGPGTYYEHIVVRLKSITFIGREGADATILDGSQPIDGREGSVLYTDPNGSGDFDLVVVGLTVSHGSGCNFVPDGVWGGGLADFDAQGGTAKIQHCVFEDNVVTSGTSDYGGAVALAGLGSSEISDCKFRGNRINLGEGGGGVAFRGGSGHVLVQRCTFDLTGAWLGGGGDAIYALNFGDIQILDNTFLYESSLDGDNVVELYAANGVVQRNSFSQSVSDYVGFLYCQDPWGTGHHSNTLDVSHNKFWESHVPPWPCVELRPNEASITCTDNFFVRCPVSILSASGSLVDFARDALYDSQASIGCSGVTLSTCVVTWPSAVTDNGYHNLHIDRNVVKDPLLCSDGPDQFDVAANSPCLSDPLLPGCGVIGDAVVGCGAAEIGACCVAGRCLLLSPGGCETAHGTYQGDGVVCYPDPCLPIPTRIMTWGQIKSSFK